MAVDVRILTAALVILAAQTTYAQNIGERCGYMVQIPRPEERPELPEQNFDGLSWTQRPLVPAEDRLDLCMDIFSVSPIIPNESTQVIFMEEEIEGDVPIAKLNYQGSETPSVAAPFAWGTFSMLAPVIRRIPTDDGPGDWHLVITNRQDFETPGMQLYEFHITVPGQAMVARVRLQIVNIDDNAPIINLTGPCEIAEFGETGLTTCKYEVSDADGEISTRFMRFTIDSDRGDELVFELIREYTVPNTWRSVYMRLVVKQPLDYEESPLHIFRVTAWDSFPNKHEVTMMVEVENVERRPPRWMEIFAVQQFDEKTKKSFRVRAIDGDTGINKPIYYRLQTDERDKDLFAIEALEDGHGGAWLHVGPIDRDELKREVFSLSIIAYKYGDNDVEGSPSYETPAHIVIIINDVNDQAPVPFQTEYTINIMEETAMTLNLENFGFHDRDLGPHAQYTVHLETVYPPRAHEAFYIAPEVGYQSQSFIIGTQNHGMLDYDLLLFNEKEWSQKIQLRAVAIDMDDNKWIGVATININLINWNDEVPIFNQAVHTATFPETHGAGYLVSTALAKDRDIDDRVEHSLMGNAVDFLRIDKASGAIYVKVDNAFNYHRQNQIFVQIQASDTLGDGPYNHATSQLVIDLQDINNTPPTLRLPRNSPHVKENVAHGHLITEEVTATDPDTTAELHFEIMWDLSYATKQGRDAPAREFHNCVEIKTIYPNENNRGVAVGRVEVREIREGVTIDYEEFEVLYLVIRVWDINTAIGDDFDEATFTIPIIDMNDNAPIWGEGQLAQVFRVRERSLTGVVIGSVFATDIDGPLYNQVRYTIKPKDGTDTPPDLVAIDFFTGQITVQKNQSIDADEPPRLNLYYTVIASDKCSMEDQSQCPPDPTYWETGGDLKIQILDINNKVPFLEADKFKANVSIYEDAITGDKVTELFARDLDRDLPNNNVSYLINYNVVPRLRDFFAVDLVTGVVRVEYTGLDVLDRDGTEPWHIIHFTIMDNFLREGDGNHNQIEAEVLVILLDVNDNAPELPEPDKFSWTVSESLLKGESVPPIIFAPDRDEPGTPNSLVAYAILGLTTERDINVPNLFNMITIETDRGIDQTGELQADMDLRGYWGTYKIHIEAYDHGVPQQKSDEKYELVIRPYNFHEPKFVFPKTGSVIRLSRERAVVGGVLSLAGVDAGSLERISATDEDGLHAGTVTFAVIGNVEAADYFEVSNDGVNSATLTLRRPLPASLEQCELIIRAVDGGDEPGPKSTDSTVTVVIVPQEDPVFTDNSFTMAFVELDAGLLEQHPLPLAQDPKNVLCDGDCYDIYYSIIDGNAAGYFVLDGRYVRLARQLNRDEHVTHTLRVAVSNTPGATSALPASILTVTINVREANPRPHFDRPLYTAGISTTDNVDRPLITVVTTHTENLDVSYSIDEESMVVDSSLEAVKEHAFEIDPVTGLITLKIQPTASMHGMFEFYVVATDIKGATSRSAVKVYLISSRNRVYFLFLNPQELVNTHRDFIAETFSNGFGMTCNIDQTLPATDANGIASETSTEVRAHFIQDDLPVPAEAITELRDDTQLLRTIQSTLLIGRLELADVTAGAAPVLPGGEYALAVYILAGIAGLLAVLCLVLLITFIIRNRVLNRRIAALSVPTKFGSMDSGLNRAGLAAPNTNKHAVEGSNPIWNETIRAPDFDALSQISNDSDLIGIEDLPQFRNDYFLPDQESIMRNSDAENPGVVDEYGASNPVANHGNNFGFNSTPFSPEFANTQLRR